MKARKQESKSKSSLIQALFSKDKGKIKQALGMQKPLKVLFFSQEEDNKIYLEEGLDRKEVSLEEKEAMIKEYESQFNLIVFNEEKSSIKDAPIKV